MNPDKIKKWLYDKNRSRVWLADHCGVSKTTVDGWLSANRPIPKPSQKIIQKLMSDGTPSVNPRMTLSQYAKAEEIAKANGQTVTEWIEDLINKATTLAVLGGILYFIL